MHLVEESSGQKTKGGEKLECGQRQRIKCQGLKSTKQQNISGNLEG